MSVCVSYLSEKAGDVESALRLLCGVVGILLLVYLMAELTPRLAKLMDRLFGKQETPEPLPKPEEYKVRDPYEGELDENNENRCAYYI